MKKKDIKKFIELGLNIWNFEKFNTFIFHNINEIIRIDDLSNEFNILDSEINEFRIKAHNAWEILSNDNLNCNHNIRVINRLDSSDCVLCKQSFNIIKSDNYTINEFVDMQNLINDNETLDYDTIFVPYSSSGFGDGYTLKELYEIINKILETKNDDEEINLANEISKLNLNNSFLVKSNNIKTFQKIKK